MCARVNAHPPTSLLQEERGSKRDRDIDWKKDKRLKEVKQLPPKCQSFVILCDMTSILQKCTMLFRLTTVLLKLASLTRSQISSVSDAVLKTNEECFL